MNTPTPRTDAAWNATFDGQQISAGRTARALRECSQQLETELNAATAERDLLRACLREDWQWNDIAGGIVSRAAIDAAMKEGAK